MNGLSTFDYNDFPSVDLHLCCDFFGMATNQYNYIN